MNGKNGSDLKQNAEKLGITVYQITEKMISGVFTYRYYDFWDEQEGREEAYVFVIPHDRIPMVRSIMPADYRFGMKKPTEMALTGAGEDEVPIACINGDFYDMTNGEPFGVFVQNGRIVKDTMPDDSRFFGITDDGVSFFGDLEDFDKHKDNIISAVSGRQILLREGEPTGIYAEQIIDRHPRTGIGVDHGGNLYFVVVDGRNHGRAEGLHLERFAYFLKYLGIQEAMNLDGGGSSVMALYDAVSDRLIPVNHPADSIERSCANGLAVYVKKAADKTCRFADINPAQVLLTPGAECTFSANGLDSSGLACRLPEGCFFATDGKYGTIDGSGKYKAPDKCCRDRIYIKNSMNEIIGQAEAVVCLPDRIRILNEEVQQALAEISVKAEALIHGRPLISCSDSFVCSFREEGQPLSVPIDHMKLMTGKSGSRGQLLVSFKGTDITETKEMRFENLPCMLTGFSELPQYQHCRAAIIRPVRFFAHHGETVLDLYEPEENAGVVIPVKTAIAPSGIGIWVHCDNPDQAEFCLEADALNGGAFSGRFYEKDSPDKVWRYLEAGLPDDLPDGGSFSFVIRIKAQKDSHIYLDGVRMIFGYVNDDLVAPELKRMDIQQNDVNRSTQVCIYFRMGDHPPYALPLDYNNIRVFLDDREVTNLPGHYGVNKGQGAVMLNSIVLPAGSHSVIAGVIAMNGNQCWCEQRFETK